MPLPVKKVGLFCMQKKHKKPHNFFNIDTEFSVAHYPKKMSNPHHKSMQILLLQGKQKAVNVCVTYLCKAHSPWKLIWIVADCMFQNK